MRSLLLLLLFSVSCSPTSNRVSCADENDCGGRACSFGFCSGEINDAANVDRPDAGVEEGQDARALDAAVDAQTQNDGGPSDVDSPDALTPDVQDPGDPWINQNFAARVSFQLNAEAGFSAFPTPFVISKSDPLFEGIVAREIQIATREGGTVPFEVSDDNDEEIVIWFRANLEEATEYYLYFDNPDVIDLQMPAAVWGDEYVTVMHMGDSRDSAPGTPNGSDFGTQEALSGSLGRATAFDGNAGYLLGRDVVGVAGTSAVTACQFVNESQAQQSIVGYAIPSDDPDEATLSRFSVQITGDRVNTIVRPDDAFTSQNFLENISFNPNAPTWLCVVVDLALGEVTYSVDAEQVETFDFTPEALSFSNTPSPHAAVGAEDNGLIRFYTGTLDEVFVSRVARSPEYLSLQYRAMTEGIVDVGTRESQVRSDIDQRTIVVPPLEPENATEDTPRVIATEGFGVRVFEIISSTNGQGSITSEGGLSFWPAPNFFGDAEVRFRVTDGTNVSEETLLSFNVSAVNDIPALSGATVEGLVNTTLTRVLRASDIEDDNNSLTYGLVAIPDEGVTTLVQNTLTFEAPAEPGTYMVRVRVNDSEGAVRNALIRFVTTLAP